MIIADINKKISEREEAVICASRALDDGFIKEIYLNDFKRRFAWSTNHLEGNTLSLDETIKSIDYDEVVSGHTYAEYYDIKNLWNTLKEFDFNGKVEITEDMIKKYNGLIRGEETDYRTSAVYIGNEVRAVYIAPPPDEVPKRMPELVAEFNKKTAGSLVELIDNVAHSHIGFERLHPFSDGNGRTGRMIINRMLVNNDVIPISMEHKSKYMQGFRAYDKTGDMSLIKKSILDGMSEAASRIEEIKMKREHSRS
jgi:Fic family protein